MNKTTQAVMFSSAKEDWATPRDLAARLVEAYGITLDVCADAGNAVVPRFLSKAEDALCQPWSGVCYMNPPYGRTVGLWVEKAARSAKAGATVICLLPSRTDTRWWHAWCQPVLKGQRPGSVEFIKGRFGGAKCGAPFPSVIVVFRPSEAR